MTDGLLEDLKEIKEILELANEHYLLAGGVLLNQYREGNPHPVDEDIDLILIHKFKDEKNYEKELLNRFKKIFNEKGFTVDVSVPKLFFGAIIRVGKRVKTDLMIHEPYQDNYVLSYNQFYRWYPKKMFDNLDYLKIENELYPVPCPIKEFLFMKYRNWKIPMDTTIEKKKILSKEEYERLKPIKINWRTPKDLSWNNIEIFKKMDSYYNSIIYTAGCFDMLHIGHLTYLLKCSELGYKLIVGVGTDDYIKNFKGSKRPIIGYENRCFLLENLNCVWKTVPHAPEYDVKVYDDEKITHLVISEDYSDTPEHKIRLEEAKKRGIKIIKLKRTEGISTTKILEMLK